MTMKKLIAILLALTLMLSLCACAGESEDDTPNGPNAPKDQVDDSIDPEEPTPEPPIEVSEFGDPEDMPEPLENGGTPDEFTSDEYAITVGDRVFNLGWLYEHNIHDWAQAGITYDQINGMTGKYLDLPLTADAISALKTKISDFTMLVMLESGDGSSATPPQITVGDEIYDFEWLTSHNATEYTEAGIPADTLQQYMDAIEDNFGYTSEFRWLKIVHDRLVNGW